MDTIALTIKLTPVQPWSEIAVAQLADFGFNSFEDKDFGIIAYGNSAEVNLDEVFKETILNNRTPELKIEVEKEIIPQRNWNAEWESNYPPVEVDGKLSILAPFHDASNFKGIKIIIHPKMSFGTGHHQTTWMMSKLLLDMETLPNEILDMGTGTGVLSFLAEKLGAKNILGIDIEPWSIDSCIENAVLNDSMETQFLCGDIDLIQDKNFNMILANINKNILENQIPYYSKALNLGGKLLLSGFFETDVVDLVKYCKEYGLNYDFHITKDNWAAIQLHK